MSTLDSQVRMESVMDTNTTNPRQGDNDKTRDEKVADYNAAILENDNERARTLADELLHDIHSKIMEEDQYQARTHGN